jgi:hypothetical protein
MDAHTIGLIVLALVQLATAALVWINKHDIRKIEIATNSMKDALVAATAKASHAEGREEQRREHAKK